MDVGNHRAKRKLPFKQHKQAALVLPIYTPARARVFRRVKWIVIAGALALVYGQEAYNWSWLVISCLGPIAWTEWTRASIRRKLPIAAWPKHLYL